MHTPNVESWLADYIATQTGLPASSLQRHVAFNNYSLTSVQLVGLVRHIGEKLGRELSPTLAWEYPTLGEMTDYLVKGTATHARPAEGGPAERAGEEIAIVGMACRFPGADNLEAYWNLCWEGRDAITEIPAERWNASALFDPDPAAAGKSYSRWGGFLKHLDQFDAGFFEMSPREAVHLDPRQRLALELSWEALEDASVPPSQLKGTNAGVFFATLADDYGRRVFAQRERIEAFSGTGTAHSMVANRLSYFYDIHGPSMTVDTACSGSLVAVHLGSESLRRRECNLVLAGGVNVILSPDSNLFFSRAGALSKDGRCKTFDSSADGFTRSEGIGVLVLKRLADAVEHGDRIYAVVRGSAVNQDGRTNGIMAPSPQAQTAVLRDAYRHAGVSPGHVQYIEAHGTGTKLGDPIEAQALGDVLGEGRPEGLRCLIGSVKTNIGHCEAAAGVAGIIKTALAIHRGKLPPSIHFKEANPLIPFSRLPFRVADRAGEWPDASRRLLAGVSSFGFGGTNAHVVLASAPREPAAQSSAGTSVSPLLLSAPTPAALRDVAKQYASVLRNGAPLADVADATRRCRQQFKHRLGLVTNSSESAADHLAAFANGDISRHVTTGAAPAKPSRTIFVYSGQGTHWPSMGLQLLENAVARKCLETCDGLARQHAGFSLLEEMNAPESSSQLDRTDRAQPAIFAVQAALTDLLRSWDIRPDAVIGQSLGEVAAAYASEALSLEDAFRVACERGRLMRQAQGHGRTAHIALPRTKVQETIREGSYPVHVAGVSSPQATVVAGGSEDVARFVAALDAKGIFARLLKGVDVAFHSPHMDPLRPMLEDRLAGLKPRTATVPFFSSLEVAYMSGRRLDATYWGRNLRAPFLFADAVAELIQEGPAIFVEVSPHEVLSAAIVETASSLKRDCVAIPTLRRRADAFTSMAEACAKLYVHGALPLWSEKRRSRVALPSYPWQRERFWMEERGPSQMTGAGSHPLLGSYTRLATEPRTHVWEIDLSAKSPAYLSDHKVFGQVVFPASAYIEMARAAGAEIYRAAASVALEDLQLVRAISFPDDQTVRLQLCVTEHGREGAAFAIHSFAADDHGRPNRQAQTLHAKGKLRRLGAPLSPNAARPAPVATKELAATDHYAFMRSRGLDYGPRFQSIGALALCAGEVSAQLDLSDSVASELPQYQLHPACLDGAFQSLAPLAAQTAGDDAFLPVGADRIQFFQRGGKRTLVRATHRTIDLAAGIMIADLDLRDEAGHCVATIEGFRLKRVGNRQTPETADPKSWLYELLWQRVDAPVAPAASPRETWAIFGGGHPVAEALAAQLRAAGHDAITVRAGNRSAARRETDVDTIDPTSAEECTQVLQAIASAKPNAAIAIVNLWALSEPAANDRTGGRLTAATLALVQACVAVDRQHRMYIVTRGAANIAERAVATDCGRQSTVWGLGRMALFEEHVGLKGKLIDLDPAEPQPARDAEAIVRCVHLETEDQLACRGADELLAVRLKSIVNAESSAFAATAAGTYLITGGFGALGRDIALWLSEHGARRIVLMGRTPLPPRKQWRNLPPTDRAHDAVRFVQSLEAKGTVVEIATADVTDLAAVQACRDAREEECLPPVTGIFHVAGVMHNARIAAATSSHVDEIFRAKALGALNLAEVFGDRGLECFVLFSSLAAVIPAIGQGVYAAANAFLSGWAAEMRRRGVAATTIDWGPWKTGMMAQAGHETFHASRGMYAMASDACTSLLDPILAGARAEWVVAATDWSLLRQSRAYSPTMLEGLGRPADDPAQSTAAATPADLVTELRNAAEPERHSLLLARVAQIVAWIFRTNPEKIDPDQSLITLGLDSLLATELKNRLEVATNVRLSAPDLLNGINLREIARRGLEQLLAEADALAAVLSDAGDEEVERMLSEVESMTDEQIAHELGQPELG